MAPRRLVLLLATALPAACAAPGTEELSDGGHRDLAPSRDAPAPDGACQLGTPEHCGQCGMACPGADNAGTRRVCTAPSVFGLCDVVCLGEYYDLNGKLDDGCEALDAPAQDAPETAVAITLPDVIDDPQQQTNPHNVIGYIYDDTRQHDTPPTQRPLGRDDWWAVTAVGAGDPGTGMVACLGITNFPVDDVFQVCISDINQVTFASGSCAGVQGGGPSTCVLPPARSDAGGPYYVRVRKLSGSNTALGYALYLKH
jgi:hypothetical protein